MAPDRPTRVAVDLLDAAAVEGARQSRSAKQQLDHWLRVGRAVSMHNTASRLRIEATLAGTASMHTLSPDEQMVVNAELDALIEASARSTRTGPRLAAEGITTVALDDEGNLVEHRPDGTSSIVG